jgi:hypothetical protein
MGQAELVDAVGEGIVFVVDIAPFAGVGVEVVQLVGVGGFPRRGWFCALRCGWPGGIWPS